jgi:hypothetical protein
MDFAPSPRAADLKAAVSAFIEEHVVPVEDDYHREVAAVRRRGDDPWQPLPLLGERAPLPSPKDSVPRMFLACVSQSSTPVTSAPR